MLRRFGVLTALLLLGPVVLMPSASARLVLVAQEAVPAVDPSAPTTTEGTPSTAAEPSTTTTNELPGTTLEAEERDDGSTSAAPWLIGSAIAALLAVGIGGWLLKRRVDREAAEVADAAGDQRADGTPPQAGAGKGRR